MAFIYGKEKRRFDAEWQKLAEEYRAAGFHEEGIQAMYDFDWAEFCRRRSYTNREQEMPSETLGNGPEADASTLFTKFDNLTYEFDESSLSGRYDWMESISDPDLHAMLFKLSNEDKELLTLYAFDGYKQAEIASKLGVSQKTVSLRIAKLRSILEIFLGRV